MWEKTLKELNSIIFINKDLLLALKAYNEKIESQDKRIKELENHDKSQQKDIPIIDVGEEL